MNDVQVNSDSPSSKNEWWEWVKALVIALALALLIRTFLFAPFVVDGVSMVPTLQDGERLIVNRAVYLLGEPKRGDIIVFHFSTDRDYIKRVIALPGDTVEVRNDQLYINGEPVVEPYIEKEKQKMGMQDSVYTRDFSAVTVEEGQLFVMGDNRPVSEDSRQIGTVDINSVVGRADLVFWPFSSFRLLD